MYYPLLIFILFAVGCTAAVRPKQIKRRIALSFQADPDSIIWNYAIRATKRWSEATGRQITLTSDGDIPIFVTSSASCANPDDLPPGVRVGACSPGIGTPDARIEIPDYIPEDRYYMVILHEIGHHLRGSSEHLDIDTALMTFKPVPKDRDVTIDDILWVCETFECAIP